MRVGILELSSRCGCRSRDGVWKRRKLKRDRFAAFGRE